MILRVGMSVRREMRSATSGRILERQLRRQDAQHEGGHVLDQQTSLAVEHQAARDRDRSLRRQLLLGVDLVAGPLRDLQLEQAQAQAGHGQDDGDAEGHEPRGQVGACRSPLWPTRSGSPVMLSPCQSLRLAEAQVQALARR